MSTMDDRWNLKHELDRKAFETVEWLIGGFNAGRLTPEQLSTGLDALFMAVSGLADDGVVDLITAGSEITKLIEAPTLRHCMLKGDKVVALTWTVASEQIEIVAYTSGVETSRQAKIYDTAKLACAAMQKAADKLAVFGYTKL